MNGIMDDWPGSTGHAPARGADADAAHGFDAAAHGHAVLARHHLRGGEVHGVEAGGAEAVDLHAGDVRAVIGDQGRGAGDVAARLPHRIDAAEDHVVHERRVEACASFRARNAVRPSEGRDLMQAPSALPRPRGVRTWS